ncbi:MAG: hypothetical protein EOO22_08590, partial [Comamonadaceae bacterium]
MPDNAWPWTNCPVAAPWRTASNVASLQHGLSTPTRTSKAMDSLLLARIQFGFTISFHIVFPALTIGL